MRGFLTFLAAVSFILAVWLTATREIAFVDALRLRLQRHLDRDDDRLRQHGLPALGAFAVGLFLLLTFVGGCSGSTAGAIKIYRLQVAGILTRSHFLHLISPNRVVTLVYNGRRLPEDVPFSVVAFLAIYMTTVGIFTVLLTAMGLDVVTSLSSAASALGNVGPGLGAWVGPAREIHASLPAAAKWVLSFAMMLGRLELFTVLVLLRPEFWRS